MRILVIVPVILSLLAGCQHPKQPPAAEAAAPADIDALKQTVALHPEDLKTWILLGNRLYDTDRWPEAIEAYEKALALDPKNVDVRVDLGTCYRNAGDPERAMEEYRRGIETDPAHANAHRNAGVVLAYDLNRPREAAAELERYLELSPNVADRDAIKKEIERLQGE